MNILIIGSGGREHALVYALSRSTSVEKVYSLTGNGGINQSAVKVDIDSSDFEKIAEFCQNNDVELVVVGSEAPLVNGIVDKMEEYGINVFGPSAKASKIEGSKEFMKRVVSQYAIPTAEYESFTNPEEAKAYVHEKGAPIVIKTDGLAAGKGVIIAETEKEAITAIDEMFGGKFGDAGNKIVIEEFLTGEEVSFFAISDGNIAIPFSSAQDHKRVGEGDTGLNTGGMGTYSPSPIVSELMNVRIMEEIINPLIDGMKNDGTPYRGVLFAGIMVDTLGNPILLEFNIRFGDPECQVLMPRLKSDLLPILLAASKGNLKGHRAEFSDKTALCVVMAANGYPNSYEKGTEIRNIEHAEQLEDIIVFHAGTKYEGDRLVAIGGRVLGVTAMGDDVRMAQKNAYEAVDKIDWKDGFCRRDIGWRAINPKYDEKVAE